MGEVISIREILREMRRTRRRVEERESLERAVEIMKANLRDVTRQMVVASQAERVQLVDRAEGLIEMIRYGLRMLGEPHDEFDPSWLDPND